MGCREGGFRGAQYGCRAPLQEQELGGCRRATPAKAASALALRWLGAGSSKSRLTCFEGGGRPHSSLLLSRQHPVGAAACASERDAAIAVFEEAPAASLHPANQAWHVQAWNTCMCRSDMQSAPGECGAWLADCATTSSDILLSIFLPTAEQARISKEGCQQQLLKVVLMQPRREHPPSYQSMASGT